MLRRFCSTSWDPVEEPWLRQCDYFVTEQTLKGSIFRFSERSVDRRAITVQPGINSNDFGRVELSEHDFYEEKMMVFDTYLEMQYLLRTCLVCKLEHQKEDETTSRDPVRAPSSQYSW